MARDIYIAGNFDNTEKNSDNNLSYWDENTRVITPDKMMRLNDPSCKHEWELDPTEDTINWYGIKCKNCIVGKLIKR